MTPPEVLAVLDVGIRGTELPPTLEAAHAQLRDLSYALMRLDTDGEWLTRDEADLLAVAAQVMERWNRDNAHPEERMGGEVEYYERADRYARLATRLMR